MDELVVVTGVESLAASRGPASVRRLPAPADALLHPVALLALAVMVVNDHLLKHAWPGVLTGKLSDFAGLVVFPLFLLGSVEVVQWLAGRWRGPDQRVLSVLVVATVVVFALAKTVPAANALYAATWGFLQWLPSAAANSLAGAAVPAAWHVRLVADPTDLICLPAALIPLWIGRRRAASASG